MSTGMIKSGESNPAGMMEFVKSLGKDIAVSKMFGAENEYQGRVLALACLVRGRDPLSLPMEYHLMGGKLTLRADAMLGRFSAAGGEYQIIEHSPNAAEIQMVFKGRKFHQRFTWEEAQQEPFVYEGKGVAKLLVAGKQKELTIKENYSTPRRRMQQLWCRVVSDGVRVVAPELVTGSYTPEETADYTGMVVTADSLVRTDDSDRTEFIDSSVVDAVAEAVVEPTKPVEKIAVAEITTEQAKEIEKYFDLLGAPQAARDAALAKRDATLMSDLTAVAAADLLSVLKSRFEAKVATNKSSEEPVSNPTEAGSLSSSVDGPITKELLEKVVAKFREAAQSRGELTAKVRDKLMAAGLRLSDLSFDQGRKLLRSLEGEEISDFFDIVLNKNLQVEPVASDATVPDV